MSSDTLPLSLPQREVWLEQLRYPDVATHTIGGYVAIPAAIDPARFNAATQHLIDHYDTLRIVLDEPADDGIARQRILDTLVAQVAYTDLSTADNPERAAHALMNQAFAKPFILTQAPLWEYRLIRVRPKLTYWFLRYHHLILDGWTLAHFTRVMSDLYQGVTLKAPRLSYRDFILASQRFEASEHWQREQAFWTERLMMPPEPIWPRRGSSASEGSPARSAVHRVTVAPEVTLHQTQLAQQWGVSRFQLLLTTLCAVLARTYQRTDIWVGIPVLNRNGQREKAMAGLFANILPLQMVVSPDQTVAQLARQAGTSLRGLLRHQRFPLGEIQRLVSTGGAHSARLYDVAVSYTEHSFDGGFGCGAPSTAHSLLHGFEQTPLMVHVRQMNADQPFSIEFVYNLDHLEQAEVARLAERLLHQLATAPNDSPISQLSILTAEEARKLATWRRGPALPHQLPDIMQRFDATVLRAPTATALYWGSDAISYAELDQRANQWAHWLMQQVGTHTDEPLVGLALPRCPDLVIAVLAVLKAGLAYVPLDPAYPRPRLAAILAQCNPEVILTEARLATRLPATDARCLFPSDAQATITSLPKHPPTASLEATQLAYVLFTSGSTGTPKGVMIERRSTNALVQWAVDHLHHDWFAGTLASTSMNFDLAVFELLVPLAMGGSIILINNVTDLPHCPNRDRVTLINTVPSVLTEVVASHVLPSSVRAVLLAGEPLARPLVDRLYEQGVDAVLNLYGPTEDTTYSTWYQIPRDRQEPPPIGRPISGTTVDVLDANLQPLPVGAAGQLYLGGAGLARGYLGRADLTAERFVASPGSGERRYRTGDRVRWRSDGVLEYLGRLDHQVKLRGFRIELGEIERQLAAYPGIDQVAIDVRQTAQDRYLVAWYTGSTIADAALHAWLREALPPYMVPTRYIHLDALPRTPNGKLDRAALPVPTPAADNVQAAPTTATERFLADLWCKLLDRTTVSLEDDFFALGGHSLLALRVAAAVDAAFSVRLTLPMLFKHASLQAMAQCIDAAVVSTDSQLPHHSAPGSASRSTTLSAFQQQLWLLDHLEAGSAAYNMPAAFRLRGRLDIAALTQAFEAIVARHEQLRARFPAVNGQPTLAWCAPYSPLQFIPGTAPTPDAVITTHARQPFDLQQGPLLRVTLRQESNSTYLLLINLHHIIADGDSVNQLLRELAIFYDSYVNGLAPDLPPLTLRYHDYVAWQQRHHKQLCLPDTEAVSTWVDGAKPDQPLLTLPGDRPRPSQRFHQGAAYSYRLSPELTADLQQFCSTRGVTPFMTLLSVFQIMLMRYSGQRHFSIGVPVSDRHLAGSDLVIGPFLRTVGVRVELTPGVTFADVLARTREQSLQCFADQDATVDPVNEPLDDGALLSQVTPLRALLVMDRTAGLACSLTGIDTQRLDITHPVAKFDLTLVIGGQDDHRTGILYRWEYSQDLFDAARIARMSRHFEKFLRDAIAEPTRSIDLMPMLTDDETRQLADWSAGGPAPAPTTIMRAAKPWLTSEGRDHA